MTNQQKLQKYSQYKKIDFTSNGSELNGHCVELASYADFLGMNTKEIIESFTPKEYTLTTEFTKELIRVSEYIIKKQYGLQWKDVNNEDFLNQE